MRYLDPKADLTFKKVFGEHEDLVISLLNALLPLRADEEVIEVEYLPAELVPDNPLRKNSIVDVRCVDAVGRQFIVEMRMVWSPEFLQRVLFNSAKAYVRQLDKGFDYSLLKPVYSLNLVNDIFEPQLPEYYHYFKLVHEEHTEKVIDGLHLVFVELPKFTPHSMSEKKMQVLWLRYLTEIKDGTEKIPQELLDNAETGKAISVLETSSYNDAQLASYDKFWDTISIEKTLYNSGERKGREEGLMEGEAIGMEKGRAEGMAEGRAEEKRKIASGMKQAGIPLETIAVITGLPLEEVKSISSLEIVNKN